MKKLFGAKSKNKANGSSRDLSHEEPPAPAVPTPIHAKLATLTKPSPQQRQQQRQLEEQQIQQGYPQPQTGPPSTSPPTRRSPEEWEVVNTHNGIESPLEKPVPPIIPVSRTSSFNSIPPQQQIPIRPASPTTASLKSNRPQYASPPQKKQTTAPVALGILKALEPPRPVLDQQQHQQLLSQQRSYSDERYMSSDRHSVSDASHLPPPSSNDDQKKKRGFWPHRDRPKEAHNPQQHLSPDRGRERIDHTDPVNDLTRRIGYLTATASEDFTLVYDVCDRASASEANAKEAVRALRREFKYGEPSAQLSAARLWAIMLHNSSPIFVVQSRSRKFMDTIEELLTNNKTNPVVKERLLDVVGAAAYATRHHTRPDGFAALWRRVRPPGKPDEGVPFDTEDAMFNPAPALSSRLSQFEVPYSAQPSPALSQQHDQQQPASRTPPPPVNPPRRRKSPTRNRIIPVEEDIRRLLQECKIGHGNASLLSNALLACRPEEVKTSEIINEFYLKCRSSQDLIIAQIPWATAQAGRSRVIRDAENEARQRTLPAEHVAKDAADDETLEEKLLENLLASNADLVEAFRQYDDLIRLADERRAEERSRKEVRMGPRERDLLQQQQAQGEYVGGSVSRSPSPSLRSHSPSPGSILSQTRYQQQQPHHHHHPSLQQQNAMQHYDRDDADYAGSNANHPGLAPPPNAPHGPRSPGQFSIRSRTPSPSIGSHYGHDRDREYHAGSVVDHYGQQPHSATTMASATSAGTATPNGHGGNYHNGGGYYAGAGQRSSRAYDQMSHRSSLYGENEDGTPIRPSAKALGKRKVVEPLTPDGTNDTFNHQTARIANGGDPYEDDNFGMNGGEQGLGLDEVSDGESTDGNGNENGHGGGIGWRSHPVQYVYDAAAERTQERLRVATNALQNGVH
ncbi:hypothetical protein DFP72DRAFT_909441 [Ephemerocybe angulata]|uniref:VHS domain-containing protein n=1 Tax=Ephemerocybe angulata TaxID=980116 RepID=A0A8H6M0F7_9AGAR|nr:hypothetical protein DFP72DRAFT_909441 [Tulosesus angulatus]